MKDLIYFSATSIIVIALISIILKILVKKFNPEKSKVKLYGLLQGMSNSEIISISCSIISYVFMVYLMASFSDVNIYIIVIILLLSLVSGILIKNKYFFVNVIMDLISLGGIKIVYLIYDYIQNEYMDMWMTLLMVFVMIFLFLYLSYTLLNNLRKVVLANKYVRKGDTNAN